MSLKISRLLLFGILTFVNGKPSHDAYSQVIGIQKLLQKLTNQHGLYDIELSHHEDGPNTHHVDRASISHHDGQPYAYNNNRESLHHYQSPHRHADDRQSNTNIQTQHFSARKKLKNIARMGDNDMDEINKVMEMESDRICKKKPKEYNCKPPCPPIKSKCGKRMGGENKGENEDENEGENPDEVLVFLNGLDKNLELRTDNSELETDKNNKDKNNINETRCFGDTCGKHRDDNDRNHRDNLRCSGRSCGRSNDLRCRGGKCGMDDRQNKDDIETRLDREDSDNRMTFSSRCTGISCSRSRKDDENDLKYAMNRISNADAMMLDPTIKNILSQINVENADVYRFG